MNVNIALDLDTIFNGVVLQLTHRIQEINSEVLGWIRGPLMYLEFVDFRYICDARICDELTVISSVEAIP